MWKLVRLAVVLLAVVVCSCGGGGDSGGSGGSSGTGSVGGGGGDDGGGTPSPGESAGTSLTADNATITSKAISSAAAGVTESINNASPSAMSLAEKTLTELKDTGSFTRTATGSGGGTCTLTGSGASELNSDPMTFSISGTMVCSSYVTTVTASTGDTQVTLDGTISASMSGSISQSYSTVETSFTINWSDLTVNIGSESYSSVSGNYSLSLVGSNGVMSVTESGTVGNQSVSQTYTFTYGYSTAVYDYFSDTWVVYKDYSLYLGDYQKYEGASRDTCSNDFFTDTLPNVATISSITDNTLRFDNRLYTYDADYPHFDGSDSLKYWYEATTYVCLIGLQSYPNSGDYGDFAIMSCSGGGDVCGVTYKRTNATAVKSFTKAMDDNEDQEIQATHEEQLETLHERQ